MFPTYSPSIIDDIVHIVSVELTNSIVEFRPWGSRLNAPCCDFAASSDFYRAVNLAFVVLCSTVRLARRETILPYHFQRTNGLHAYIPIFTP